MPANCNPTARILSLVLVSALLSLAACSPEPSTSLRLGICPWPVDDFLYLAEQKEFTHDEGLDLRIVEFSSVSDARRAYERGKIDALAATVVEVLQIRDDSTRSPQIVQVLDYSDGADVILARAGITNLAGLRGARIGMEPASLSGYVLGRALEKAGLSLADVKPVSLVQLDLHEAFRRGELDAIVTYPPASLALMRNGRANKIFSTAEIPGEVLDVIAVEADVITKRSKDVAALLRAYHRALVYARENPADAYRIMAERENITPEDFHLALKDGIRLLSDSDQATYLRPDGKLAAVIDTSDRLLRQSGQINGPDRRAGASTSTFLKN